MFRLVLKDSQRLHLFLPLFAYWSRRSRTTVIYLHQHKPHSHQKSVAHYPKLRSVSPCDQRTTGRVFFWKCHLLSPLYPCDPLSNFAMDATLLSRPNYVSSCPYSIDLGLPNLNSVSSVPSMTPNTPSVPKRLTRGLINQGSEALRTTRYQIFRRLIDSEVGQVPFNYSTDSTYDRYSTIPNVPDFNLQVRPASRF